MSAPQLYLITDRHATSGRPLPQVIDEALSGLGAGARVRVGVQLRDKDLSGAALYALAVELRKVTRFHQAQFFVNGRVDVAMACGADGVHLGAGSLPISVVKQLSAHLLVGVSTHAIDDVRQAGEEGADFVVFGPIFPTPSKQGILEARGLEALKSACTMGIPLVALGGIDAASAAACCAAGAAGIAVIRAVLQAPLPGPAARQLGDCFLRAHQAT